jgi:hypothetical protein
MRNGILILMLFIVNITFSQDTIRGVILDPENNGLPGVSIILTNTTIGTITDLEGKFVLKIPNTLFDTLKLNDSSLIKKELLINYVGYLNKIVEFDNAKSISINININKDDLKRFPWPPPNFSARTTIHNDIFTNAKKLMDVNNILNDALNKNGYYDKSYYQIPDGFALVTRIEQIDKDGYSLEIPDRWNIKTVSDLSFNLASYLKALFFSNTGYFRIIVFAVTDVPYTQSGSKISREEAELWLNNGYDKLPKEIGNYRFSEDYLCTALIYEFKKPESSDAILLIPSNHTGTEHLIKSKLRASLEK